LYREHLRMMTEFLVPDGVVGATYFTQNIHQETVARLVRAHRQRAPLRGGRLLTPILAYLLACIFDVTGGCERPRGPRPLQPPGESQRMTPVAHIPRATSSLSLPSCPAAAAEAHREGVPAGVQAAQLDGRGRRARGLSRRRHGRIPRRARQARQTPPHGVLHACRPGDVPPLAACCDVPSWRLTCVACLALL
jgi:hypothetical protein